MQQTLGKVDYRFYKVPQFAISGQEGSIVGILDASGSMSSYWKVLAQVYNNVISKRLNTITLTFDTGVNQKPSPQINENIKDHGGGGTDIVQPFNTLNNLIKRGDIKTQNLTVIFVSDGADQNPNTLNQRLDKLKQDVIQTKTLNPQLRINFLCVAVGKGFPTFIAMAFREMYHTGDATAPPVFLIEPVEGKNLELFTEEFTNLVPYLGHEELVSLEPALYKYPWDTQPVANVFANSWVCAKNFSEKILVRSQESTVTVEPIEEPFNINIMLEMIKEWVQQLTILSLNKPAVEQAKIALELSNKFRENILGGQQALKLSFNDRLKLRGKFCLEESYNELVQQIRKLAEQEIMSKLTQEEAAKRLAIGTKVGKYHSIAIKLRGITVKDYVVARDSFIKLHQDIICDYQKSAQEPSVIIMQNQKDVFGEPDLIEGLKSCPSQYDLVEAFPIIGHGIQVVRREGALVNPWMIFITDVAKHHKIMDSVSLQQRGGQIEFQTGNGDTEVINCILPLFKIQPDSDIAPLIQSKLYHILMTFIVMQNADTMFETAYPALLANTFIWLIQQSKSTWRDELIDQIYETSKMTYFQSKEFQHYIKALAETPNTALVTEHPDVQTKCEDPSKAIYALFYIMRDQPEVFEEKKEEIVQRILCETFGRLYPNESPIEELYEISNKEELQKLDFSKYVNDLLGKFNMNTLIKDFYTLTELKGQLSYQFSQVNVDANTQFHVTLDLKRMGWPYQEFQKYNLQCLQAISQYFLGRLQTFEEFQSYTYHASIRNSFERSQRPIIFDQDEIINNVSRLKMSAILSKNSLFNDTFNQLAQVYKQQMIDTHLKVLPTNKTAINIYCKQHGIQKPYRLTNSLLLKHACLAVDCPHFMKYNPSLLTHIENSPATIPGFHKTIKEWPKDTAENLFILIREGKCLQLYHHLKYVNKVENLITQEIKQMMMDKKSKYLELIELCQAIYKNQSH